MAVLSLEMAHTQKKTLIECSCVLAINYKTQASAQKYANRVCLINIAATHGSVHSFRFASHGSLCRWVCVPLTCKTARGRERNGKSLACLLVSVALVQCLCYTRNEQQRSALASGISQLSALRNMHVVCFIILVSYRPRGRERETE